MSIKCIARQMAGGNGHEHISHIRWLNTDTNQQGLSARAEMVDFIERNGNASVWCPDRNPALKGAYVHVNHNGRTKYIQTVADGRWTDNLLSLPEESRARAA